MKYDLDDMYITHRYAAEVVSGFLTGLKCAATMCAARLPVS